MQQLPKLILSVICLGYSGPPTLTPTRTLAGLRVRESLSDYIKFTFRTELGRDAYALVLGQGIRHGLAC